MTQVQSPKISVIMPTYNAEKHLHQAIDSILNQTFKEFEFLIMNDGSTDSTQKILEEYAKKDPRIKLFHQANQGLVKTLNTLANKASTNLLARMDADDIANPTRLEKQYNHLLKHPKTVLLGTKTDLIDEQNNSTGQSLTFEEDFINRWFLCLYPPVTHSSVVMCKDAFDQAGKYQEHEFPAEDYGLWTRLKRFGQIENLGEILNNYRINNQGISSQKLEEQMKVRDQLRKVNFEDIFNNHELESAKKIAEALKKYQIGYMQKHSLGKLFALTGCFLIEKNEYSKAKDFFLQSLHFDKKRILDSLPNMLLGFFGLAYLISLDYSPFKSRFYTKILWFKKAKNQSSATKHS